MRRRADLNVCSGSGRTLQQILLMNSAEGRGERTWRHRSAIEGAQLVQWVETTKQFTSAHWAVDTRSSSKLRRALRSDEVLLSDLTCATDNGVTPLSLARGDGAAAAFYSAAWLKDDARLEMVRLLQLALAPWSPQGHQVFPWRFRAATMTVLQVGRHLRRHAAASADGELESSDSRDSNTETSLPSCAPPLDFWLTVMSYCGRDDWCDVPETSFASSMARRATPLE